MVFGYAVKMNGRWYNAFEEIEDSFENAMPAPESDVHAVDLSDMDVADLKKMCEENGIALPKKCTKSVLVKLLSE